MKRLLLIFLLIALPFQYSWAAAAAYCQHEKAHPTHFGHHAHDHQAQAEDSKEKDKLPKFHSDCGYCHLSCQATALPGMPDLTIPDAVAPPLAPSLSFSSFFPEGPRRPDRLLVA